MRAPTVVNVAREGLRKPTATNQQILVTGAIGAFAPQVLRWYTQPDLHVNRDPWGMAGYVGVMVLFLALAGYVTMLWGVRTLREAFLVGLAVPSIILGPGSDLASLAKPEKAHAQSHPAVGVIEIRAHSQDGKRVTRFRTIATDGSSSTYSTESGYLTLPAGRYRLSILAGGYETAEEDVTVAPRQHLPFNVTLHRLSPAQRVFQGAADAVRRY